MTKKYAPLIIFEMANNHMGDVKHGIKIVHKFAKAAEKFNSFNFAFKLQARDIDTFIHPDFKSRQDIKYVKRFSETRLTKKEYKTLKKEIEKCGFVSICTPFDEASVDLIEELDFQIIKIASCSLADWPLLERIAKTNKPIIFSTGGARLEDIDQVVSFFQHRDKEFALMHCVGEYPTLKDNLQLNQIDLLRERYPDVPVGYSTHKEPENNLAIALALAKGARIIEKHVGVRTKKYDLNTYSSTPKQVEKSLKIASEALKMGGVIEKRHTISEKEKADLRQFQRGVFANCDIIAGEPVNLKNTFFAFPNSDGQIITNNLSKYVVFTAKKDVKKNQPVMNTDVVSINIRESVYKIVSKVQKMLNNNKIVLPSKLEWQISHHYGLENFHKNGAVLITVVNREYAKKILVLLPKQIHPSHLHRKKEETFHVLSGDFILYLNNKKQVHKAGEVVIVERNIHHWFTTNKGVILEEVSTTAVPNDSFYEDEKITQNKNRKTYLTYWQD
ncbi:MAG: spore coat protein [Candidatus Blackburnbacteria bacterium RIFCSPHIGHO2_01_FULL_40_17]|uniref:Spore coat protein n=1 Tax=Candidatus Blackburnbacteria bacterium RIFCSPLOWO2_01_FULL_40_20 TaxID=1797519 RepID=A0A1G1VB24_9BACT|nr:MAG: spore coat protein [Candidatus Blackburnbacteria bacterium RIFCSPHIGHO2_01_FULL_40_17]OGY12556.1 MAG: spore coat protein [Candidatus Blackburnbacteria bacterium RIFCSPLOWO2_01_FULL_40_20]OGY14962.1 MAG: spore coat protein [Candidatus Blackburnbacteria bacterium RIFCSPLOWO2_02_FULL_40_10]